jgi:hypothetical protein
MKRNVLVLLCLASFLLAANLLSSEANTAVAPVGLGLAPSISLPISDNNLFKAGAGAKISARFPIGTLPLTLGPDISYVWQPLQNVSDSLSEFALGVGVQINLQVTPWLLVSPYGEGGYFYGLVPGSGGGSIFVGAGVDAGFLPWSSFGVDLLCGYRYNIGLYHALQLGLMGKLLLRGGSSAVPQQTPARPTPKPLEVSPAAQAPRPSGNQALQVSSQRFDPVFPVLFKFYDEHPVGNVILHNAQATALENVKVSFYINQYMDNPKLCSSTVKLEPGKDLSTDLFALFNNKILEISEGTKVSARVVITYTIEGKQSSEEIIETVRIYDRNASMWDDNRKAAAFVTSKDPTVLRFAKNVLGMIKDKGSKAINSNLLTAMAFHEATRLYGLTYVADPTNSYAETLKSKTAVDFLQFPRQTLDYKGGNCSGLSILYAALFESVGIETAFITVPGHILMAVSLGISPDQARREFRQIDDLILTTDKCWIPIETTDRSADFLQAWKDGAKQWRENLAKKQADFYPVHEAWNLYEPVGFASDLANIPVPDQDKVVSNYLEVVIRYIDAQIYESVAKLNAEISRTDNSPQALNKLGVLYARYGLYDKAVTRFQLALKRGEFVPALVNLGNISFHKQKYRDALAFYERACRVSPENPAVLLGLARANHELENYGVVKDAYGKLKVADAALAERFAYLDLRGTEGTRAAEVSGAKEVAIWVEE